MRISTRLLVVLMVAGFLGGALNQSSGAINVRTPYACVAVGVGPSLVNGVCRTKPSNEKHYVYTFIAGTGNGYAYAVGFACASTGYCVPGATVTSQARTANVETPGPCPCHGELIVTFRGPAGAGFSAAVIHDRSLP